MSKPTTFIHPFYDPDCDCEDCTAERDWHMDHGTWWRDVEDA